MWVNNKTKLTISTFMVLAATQAKANVTFYDTDTNFFANNTASLRVTFDPTEGEPRNTFYSQGGVAITGPTLAILGSYRKPDLLTTGSSLGADGNEVFDFTFGGASTHAVGFNVVTNAYGPPIVSVFSNTNQFLGRYTLNQAPETRGFIGISSDQVIGRIHYMADHGEAEDTFIDNIFVDNASAVAAVPEPSTYAMMFLGLGFMGFVCHRKSGNRLSNFKLI